MGENAYIDANSRNTLTALANDGSGNIFNIRINPVTGAVIVETDVVSSNTSIGSTIPGGTAGSVLFLDIGSTLGEDNANFFYDPTDHYLGLGTDTPSATLDVNGTFKYTDGTQANGYILTSDGSGNATWQEAPTGGLADPGSNGIVVRTALDTTETVTITGTVDEITIENGDGIAGNPTISIATGYVAPIINGGTGQTSANDALNALLPSQTGESGNFLTTDGTDASWISVTPGTGTVTNVSVVTANGVSGTVSNPMTTPAITLVLGAITPSSVASAGTVTGSNLSGTNTGDQTITLTGDVTGSGTGSFAATIANNAVTTAKINNNAVTYAKMQQASTVTLLGNPTGGTADIEEITLGTGLSFSGTTLNSSGGGGQWSLVQTLGPTTVSIPTVTPTTILDFTGLDGDIDDEYLINFEFVGGTGSAGVLYMTCNNDTTVGHYGQGISTSSLANIQISSGSSTIPLLQSVGTILIKASTSVISASNSHFMRIDQVTSNNSGKFVSNPSQNSSFGSLTESVGAGWFPSPSSTNMTSIQIGVQQSTGSSQNCTVIASIYKINR